MQGVVQTRKFERTDPRIEETRLADEVRNTLLVGWGATPSLLQRRTPSSWVSSSCPAASKTC